MAPEDKAVLAAFEAWLADRTKDHGEQGTAGWPSLVKRIDDSEGSVVTFFALFEEFLQSRGDSLDKVQKWTSSFWQLPPSPAKQAPAGAVDMTTPVRGPLSILERTCVELVAAENWPGFRLDGLLVTRREDTGVGRYVYLEDTRGQDLTDGTYGARGRTIQMEGLPLGLDFVVDVSRSRINYLELVTAGDGWDGSERGWAIV
jgi:hypothetical protein